jgi:regulator of replication initiation timing
LKDIQSEALREVEIVESEKKEMEHIINELRNQINSLVTENNKLQRKYERSRSRKSNRGHMSNSTYITPDLCFPKLDIELSQKSNPMIQSELRNFQQSNTKEIL